MGADEKVAAALGPFWREGTCAMPGPYETHCTERPMHDYSCYDAGADVSFNGRQEWKHAHLGCPDDGTVSEER